MAKLIKNHSNPNDELEELSLDRLEDLLNEADYENYYPESEDDEI